MCVFNTIFSTASPPAPSLSNFNLQIMGKVLEKGADYLSKESARLAGMLTSESITKAKKADLLLRKNVLAAFA